MNEQDKTLKNIDERLKHIYTEVFQIRQYLSEKESLKISLTDLMTYGSLALSFIALAVAIFH